MDFHPKSIYWLVPEAHSPCDIFLHFRGQFAPAIGKSKPISLEVLEKIHKAKYFFLYIRESDEDTWQDWVKQRHPQSKNPKEAKEKNLYGNKRAEYLSYIQKVLVLKDPEDIKLGFAYQNTLQTIQKIVQSPMLDWYFQQFHEPPDLFQHSARVTLLTAFFASLYPVAGAQELEQLAFASLIHELEGDPKSSLKTVVSVQTVENLEKNRHPVPQEIIAILRDQDELCSGKGFPKNKKAHDISQTVKVFSFFNHYDHYRLIQTGTRRSRHEAVKKILEQRKEDFDPSLREFFWTFLDKQVEIIA